MLTDSRQENAIHFRNDQADNVFLNRVRSSDPELRELTLDIPEPMTLDIPGPYSLRRLALQDAVRQAFHAIATNTTLEMLAIIYDHREDMPFCFSKDHAQSALRFNTSLKDIHVTSGRVRRHLVDLVDIAMSSPNLEALTITVDGLCYSQVDVLVAQLLDVITIVRSLTLEGFRMNSACAVNLAPAFRKNQTIETLTMRNGFCVECGAAKFIDFLPPGHSLKSISFDSDGRYFQMKDNSGVRVIRALCQSSVNTISLTGYLLTAAGCERIVDILKTNEHSFTKLERFYDSHTLRWQNKIRLDIDMLTWGNQLQVEKRTWADRFLGQDNHSQETNFLCVGKGQPGGQRSVFQRSKHAFLSDQGNA
jgi:hypothetical protein